MKTNTLLLISGIASVLYAIILLAFPKFFLDLHGITTDEIGIFFLRVAGTLCIGYAILGLFSVNVKSADGLQLACRANFGAWTTMLFVMIYAKTTLPFNSFIYMDIAFSALFSILFATKAFSKQ
jgi:hypothetical protein